MADEGVPDGQAPEGVSAPTGADDDAVIQAAATLRIRQIEIAGFKSFRDRVVLRFPTGVTGIVGPNGCGKSNVVDAIRWVLGEQSAKRLRGHEMEDVIFAGSDRGSAVGMAQVSIVFETDGLPMDQFSLLKESGHPLGSSSGPAEIMVTRRYLRSGESEYLMNGVQCRLRDITELFLGTGLGGRAYAIIEQGRVERLVSAKPEELRLFIEEAAGTTLYRSRRQVAERKMERTRENLSRVLDILREVERQLATLRRQAKRAEQFKTLQAEAATLDLSLSARERARMVAELAVLNERRAELQAQQAELTASLDGLEKERQAARDHEAAAMSQIQQTQTAAFEAQSASESCRYETARLEGRIAELISQASTVEQELASASEQQASANGECVIAENDVQTASAAIEVSERELGVKELESTRLTGEQQVLTQDLDATKNDLVRALTEEAEVRNQRAAQQRRREEESERCGRLHEMLDALVVREQEALSRTDEAERRVVETQGRLEQLEGTKRVRADELRGALAERASWEVSLDGVKDGLARVRSRRDSLRELELSHATYGEGVRAVLSASSTDEALGLVAEILEIPEDLERAVAAVLGESLQAVVMRDETAASQAVQALRRAAAGRATCVPRAARTVAPGALVPGGGQRLIDLVRVRAGYEDVAESVLGHILLTEDLGSALALWRQSDAGWTLVTRSGERVDPSGAITGGSEPSGEILLTQRRELRALDGEVEQRDQDLQAAVRRQEELGALVATREEALVEVDAELGQMTVAAVGAEKDVQRARHEVQETQTQREAGQSELDDARSCLDACEEELTRLAVDLESAEGRRGTLEEAVGVLEQRFTSVIAAVAQAQAQATDYRIALAGERTRREGLLAAIERLRRTGEEAGLRVRALQERQRGDAESLEGSRTALAEAQGRSEGLALGVSEAAERVEAAQRTSTEARAAAEGVERRAGELQTDLDRIRTDGGLFDVQLAEQRLALRHLEEKVRAQYERELADLEVDETGDVEVQEERLEYLRKRIASMGEVNVAALGEVAELDERQRFLETQRGDLEQALEDLRRTINRLNRTSRTKFRETFDQVDATFREVFPKLFAGGKAQLRLTDETQILESGVEILVQLPGKRVGALALLSGGEKALTAVSLIFSLFLISPSPFCFLDEVDAPLDDANIGRFNAMVREMSAHSQFILITHNKRTMEVAETLYGVTMEEPGVSEVVSVRLPD